MVSVQQILKVIEHMETEDAKQREENVSPELRWRSISRDVAEAINLLARTCNAKTIVEIGTSQGYSTLWLALAAKSNGGKVYTFEIDAKRIEVAKNNLDEAGLSEYVMFHHANPIERPELLPESIDFVFLDAEKKDYLDHFKAFFDKLRPGGTVVADNAISHFGELREYINFVRMSKKTNSVLFPLGRGLEVTYKFQESEEADADLYFELIR